ncbi:MAG: hypothetical protein CVT92_09340 [Bacteroidetes bacterium HGW-Bacteroidetes-1]|nr:MAG: hypothetical protein CVT92_09340 [Bacteroidetes bacterium HGW-Bacteroidetes-1]
MKKYFFLPILFLFSMSSIHSQSFNGGINAGITVSQIAGDGMAGYNKAGLYGGFFVQYFVNQSSSLQMELSYIQKGSARSENPNDPTIFQYLRRLNYIELPLIFQYHLRPLIFEAGLSADFLAGSFEESNYQLMNQNDLWRKVTLNTIFGIKYVLNDNWMVSIRTVNSINSIRNNSVPFNVRRYTRSYGEFNDVLVFGLSYKF